MPCAALPCDAAAGVGRPLMVIVSRLTQQKGLPLMLHGIKVRSHSPRCSFVFLFGATAWHERTLYLIQLGGVVCS